MKLFQRITRAVARTWFGVRAAFESVRQTWGDRSWLFQSLQDSWIEIDQATRIELQRVHEALIENSPIVQKIRNLFLQFSVGPSGLICTPNASKSINPGADSGEVEAWNTARAESWERWWRRPELNCDITGAQLTRVWSGLLFDKGEIFVNLTQDERNIPRVRTIDAHRCQTPTDHSEHGENKIIDGKEYDPSGRLVAYWFRRGSAAIYEAHTAAQAEQFERIEAYDKRGRKQIIHKYKIRRPGQVRGIPEGFSVYNLVRDNMDLHKLEMQAAKLASDIANIETNPSGELDALTNRRARMGIATTDANGQLTTKNTFADYKVSIGSKNIALKSGDKLEQFMITRPTVATQQYWDLHYTLICMGYNVPKLLVMPYSLQGTVTRADLDISGFGFGQENFEIIAELLREVYEWQTEWAIKYDRSLDGPIPADYHCVFIRPPRKPNVDVGYTAQQLETELLLGARTMPDVYAEKQQDFRVKTVEIAEYLKFVQDTAAKYGVQPGQITKLLEQQAVSAGAEHQEPDGDEDSDDSPQKKEEDAD